MRLEAANLGKAGALSLIITGGAGYLLYDSKLPLIAAPAVFVVLLRTMKKREREKRRAELKADFVTAMQAVANALLAGFSMENAWREALREHEGNGLMKQGLVQIAKALNMNMPIEQVFSDFAEGTGIEEIIQFAEVFSYAKRSGGNMAEIIGRTVEQMRQKQEVLDEIDVLVASKRMEQRVMNVMPLFMILYLRLASADYMAALYHNTAGILIMTGCLVAYLGAYVLSQRLLVFEL